MVPHTRTHTHTHTHTHTNPTATTLQTSIHRWSILVHNTVHAGPIHLWKQRFSNDQMYKIYRNWKLHAWIFSLTHTLIKWTESLIVLKGKHVENCTMYTLRTNISRLCVPCWSLHFYSSSSFMRSSSPPILYNLRVHRKWRISYLCCQESKT